MMKGIKEKHWLDMEVIYRHVLTRSMTDNMIKEKNWLDMEVTSYINQVGDRQYDERKALARHGGDLSSYINQVGDR